MDLETGLLEGLLVIVLVLVWGLALLIVGYALEQIGTLFGRMVGRPAAGSSSAGTRSG